MQAKDVEAAELGPSAVCTVTAAWCGRYVRVDAHLAFERVTGWKTSVIVKTYAYNEEKSWFEASRHQGAEALPALRRSNACAVVRPALG